MVGIGQNGHTWSGYGSILWISHVDESLHWNVVVLSSEIIIECVGFQSESIEL